LSQAPAASYPPEFERLLERIKIAVEAGDLDAALALSDRAIAWGEEHGDQRAVDRALGNRAGFLIARGETAGVARQLQAVLMRSPDPTNRHLAAYYLSVLYDQRKDHDKCIFYARIARDHALKTGEPAFLSRCHNQIGNALVAKSYFQEALDEYRQALGLLPPGPGLDRALILGNAGYCHLVLERFAPGFEALFAALRMLRRLRAGIWERRSSVRLALCYGYIEIGRFERARRHGLIALRAAESAADDDFVKKALYLLGEVEKQAGNHRRAYRYFERLRARCFPDDEALTDLLMAADTHKLVNLMA